MKTVKKALAVLAALCLFVSLLGCSARRPVTMDDFKAAAEAQKFTLTDNLAEEAAPTKYMTTITDAGSELDFFVCKDPNGDAYKEAENAKTLFNNAKGQIGVMAKTNETSVETTSYAKYTVSNGEFNYVVVRMGSTVLYTSYLPADKDAIEAVLSAIKY